MQSTWTLESLNEKLQVNIRETCKLSRYIEGQNWVKEKEWLKENFQVLKTDDKTNKIINWLCSLIDEEIILVIFLDRYELIYERHKVVNMNPQSYVGRTIRVFSTEYPP